MVTFLLSTLVPQIYRRGPKKNTTHFKFANQVGPEVVSKRAIPVCQTCKDWSKLSRGESNSALLRKEPFCDDSAG